MYQKSSQLSFKLALLILTMFGQAVAADNSNVLEEIIVTAEKRSASIQDVPISISAFSGERLAVSGIDESQALEMVTPGLSMASDGGLSKVTIRGVGATRLQGPGSDPSAAIYIDGVYQSRFTSAAFDLMDVERVEILRGPQGTLYGRNANAGAIKYISKGPGGEIGANVEIKIGNYDLFSVKGHVNIPLIEDRLLLRVTGVKTTRDGYTKDILNGYESDYDDLLASGFTLKYMPSDNLDITLHGTAINDDGDFTAAKHFIDPAGAYSSATQSHARCWA